MYVGAFKETIEGECRVAISPESCKKLTELGVTSLQPLISKIQKKKLKKTTDLKSDWQMKSYYRSPAYTTRWDELLKVS